MSDNRAEAGGPAAQRRLFDDNKDARAFRTIGEVSQALAIKPHVLRYWEEQFPMLQPVKRSGSRRYYRPEDVALLRRIDDLLNRQGYTIRGAARALLEEQAEPAADRAAVADARPVPPSSDPRESTPPVSSDLVARLRALRETLAEALV